MMKIEMELETKLELEELVMEGRPASSSGLGILSLAQTLVAISHSIVSMKHDNRFLRKIKAYSRIKWRHRRQW